MKFLKKILTKIYLKYFIKSIFYPINEWFFNLSIHGIGILNYETKEKSGERYFVEKILSHYKNKDIVVFDVGANKGDYSDMILQGKNNAIVYAFEPNPKSFHELSEYAKNKKNLRLYNKGCGDSNSEMTLYDVKNDDGSELASLYKDVINNIHKMECTEAKIEIIRLDDFCRENDIKKIDLLKIDTEGNEMKVLQGAKDIIQKGFVRIIHFEFNEMNVVSRSFFKDFYDFLEGYSFFRLLPDGLATLGEYKPLFWEIFAFQNIIAVKDEEVDKLRL